MHLERVGWLAGCRPIIGIDDCFLKGVCKGQLLVAVGKDADEQMFPIAWGVIDKETKRNWAWFLQWLVKELDLGDGSKLTVISDMQKVQSGTDYIAAYTLTIISF